jgi:tape measure domain-containing protein
MATVEEVKIIVKAEVDQAIAKMNELNNVNKANTKTGADLAKSIVGYAGAYGMAVMAGQALIRGTGELIKNSITLAASVERVKMEFSVLVGGMDASNKLFDQMNKLAAETPLELQDITAAGKQLLSVGIPVGEITTKLRMLGDVAMGNPEKLDRLTMAFGQLRSKGVASMEQLNRFIEAGVPIMAELQKQTGQTGDEVFKMVSQGKIGFKDIETALKNMTGEGGLYHDMMQKVAETSEGKWSTAQDNFKMRLREIGKELLPAVNAGLDAYNKAMDKVTAKVVIQSAINAANANVLQDYSDVIKDLQKTWGQQVENKEWFGAGQTKVQIGRLQNLTDQYKQAQSEKNKLFGSTTGAAGTSESLAADAAEKAAKKLAEAQLELYTYEGTMKERENSYVAYYNRLSEGTQTYTSDIDDAALANAILVAEQDAAIEAYVDSRNAINDAALASAIYASETDAAAEAANDLRIAISKRDDLDALNELMREYNRLMGAGTESTVELTDKQKEQIETMAGYTGTLFSALGKDLADGEAGWKNFGDAAKDVLADVVEAKAKAWALDAFAAFIPGLGFNPAAGAGYLALSAAAFTGAGVIRSMAEGGYVPARSGGTVTRLGEGGEGEYVIPESRMGRGGTTIIVNGSLIHERQLAGLINGTVAKAGRGY